MRCVADCAAVAARAARERLNQYWSRRVCCVDATQTDRQPAHRMCAEPGARPRGASERASARPAEKRDVHGGRPRPRGMGRTSKYAVGARVCVAEPLVLYKLFSRKRRHLVYYFCGRGGAGPSRRHLTHLEMGAVCLKMGPS